jgi:DNA-binding MarR family transcriptional regulator
MKSDTSESGSLDRCTSTEKLCAELDEAVTALRIRLMATMHHLVSRGQITVPQLTALDILVKKGKCTMGQLTSELRLTAGAVTNLVNKLYQAGLVRRSRSPDDRRVVLVSATARGERAIGKVRDQMRSIFIQVMGRMGESQGRRLVRLYQRMSSIMDELPGLKPQSKKGKKRK